MDEIEIHISTIQVLQTTFNAILDTMMPSIVKLSRHPDLFSGHAAVFNALSHLSFVAVCKCSVDVSVAALQSDFDSMSNFVWLRLPCSQTNGRDSGAGIELEGLPDRSISDWERRGIRPDLCEGGLLCKGFGCHDEASILLCPGVVCSCRWTLTIVKGLNLGRAITR